MAPSGVDRVRNVEPSSALEPRSQSRRMDPWLSVVDVEPVPSDELSTACSVELSEAKVNGAPRPVPAPVLVAITRSLAALAFSRAPADHSGLEDTMPSAETASALR